MVDASRANDCMTISSNVSGDTVIIDSDTWTAPDHVCTFPAPGDDDG
jgi:hypothetical protein